MKQQITVEYDSPVKVVTGMILWRIESAERKTFYTNCPVCGGSRKITVNDHTFTCPQCDKLAKSTTFQHYTVQKYKVCGIDVETPYDYWKDADNEPRVKFKLFHKYGRGAYESRTYTVTGTELDPLRFNQYCSEKYAFSSYSRACELARDMNAHENEKLAAFNEEHGSEYTFDWKETNDKEEKARGSIA